MSGSQAKIVQLTTVHPRNDIRIYIKECQSLAQAFPQSVRLVVADGRGAENRADLEIVDLGALPKSKLARALLGFLRTVKLLHSTRPAVVHFHDPELIPVGMVARCLGIRVIYDVHEDVPRQIMGRLAMSRPLRLVLASGATVAEWLGGRLFNAIVPATPKIAERFPPRKTVVIQNFPLLSELAPVESSAHADRLPVFAYVGAISRMRGLFEMVEAIGRLEPDRQAQLALAGQFRPEDLQNQVARLEGYARTTHQNWLNRKEVAHLLSRARAGLVVLHPAPNHIASQPNKLFEYMSAGLPVIASDFPLWRAIVGRIRCGLLVDPQDPAAIAAAMRWILDNPQEAEAMGQRGRAAVETTYNWPSEEARLIALYRQILGRRAPADIGESA